jgi:hypothetical protein
VNDLLHYAPLLIVVVVVWMGSSIAQTIESSDIRRREDHRELMNKLEDVEDAIGRLDLVVNMIASDVAPPIDPENPPY